jgi:hypothetical protein
MVKGIRDYVRIARIPTQITAGDFDLDNIAPFTGGRTVKDLLDQAAYRSDRVILNGLFWNSGAADGSGYHKGRLSPTALAAGRRFMEQVIHETVRRGIVIEGVAFGNELDYGLSHTEFDSVLDAFQDFDGITQGDEWLIFGGWKASYGGVQSLASQLAHEIGTGKRRFSSKVAINIHGNGLDEEDLASHLESIERGLRGKARVTCLEDFVQHGRAIFNGHITERAKIAARHNCVHYATCGSWTTPRHWGPHQSGKTDNSEFGLVCPDGWQEAVYQEIKRCGERGITRLPSHRKPRPFEDNPPDDNPDPSPSPDPQPFDRDLYVTAIKSLRRFRDSLEREDRGHVRGVLKDLQEVFGDV